MPRSLSTQLRAWIPAHTCRPRRSCEIRSSLVKDYVSSYVIEDTRAQLEVRISLVSRLYVTVWVRIAGASMVY
jgi:hypothetical protein